MPNLSIGFQIAWRLLATSEAAHAHHEFIEPIHLLLGLCGLEKALTSEARRQLELPESVVAALRAERQALENLFAKSSLNMTDLRRELREQAGDGSFVDKDRNQISRSPTSKAVFERAEKLAADAPMVTTLHLLAALLEDGNGLPVQLLKGKSVDITVLKEQALSTTVEMPPQRMPDYADGNGSTELLQQYGKDLTQLAREGKLYPCIGRKDELLQILRTLNRETKNNPVLIGEAGVGKTAIVEGLAWRIAQERDATLIGKRIVQINVADLVAGTKYRGQFEERLQTILAEVAQNADILLFIDELHTLIGAGDAGGALDAANIMKPALARGELRCIGATTREEYRRYIEKDPALERRFQPVQVNEPTTEETQEILRQGYKERLEKRHRVVLDEGVLQAAVTLSARYLPDRRLPDKAIDLLEEACVRVVVPSLSIEPGQEPVDSRVTVETITEVLAQWTGIPVTQMTENERDRLKHMAEELKGRVIGQDPACEVVAQAVQRARMGLMRPGRPVGVFLFVGPTGVGKTELARATSEFLFGSSKAMVRLDMSEYMEKHNVARLIGAPPGYIRSDEEGQLTGALRRTPFCVVLLDEVEKAHPDVLNLFLQVFDDGRLTDNQDRTVDASNALFMMTSNLGFQPQADPLPAPITQGAIDSAVRAHFRIEFLNRIDEVIHFQSLKPEHMADIVRIQLQRWRQTLAERELELEVSAEAVQWLAERGYDRRFGARSLVRLIEREVINPIGGLLLTGDLKPTFIVHVTVAHGAVHVSYSTPHTLL